MKHNFAKSCQSHRLFRRGFEAIQLKKHIDSGNIDFLILKHTETVETDTLHIIENLKLQLRKREFTFSLYIFEKSKAIPTGDLEEVKSKKLRKEILFLINTKIVPQLDELIHKHKLKYDPLERRKRHLQEAAELGLSDTMYKLAKIQESMRLKKLAERRRKERKERTKDSQRDQDFYDYRDNHVNYNHLAQDPREWEQMPSQHDVWDPDKMKYVTQYLNFRTYYKFDSYVCGAVEIYTSERHTLNNLTSQTKPIEDLDITLLSPGKTVFERVQYFRQD